MEHVVLGHTEVLHFSLQSFKLLVFSNRACLLVQDDRLRIHLLDYPRELQIAVVDNSRTRCQLRVLQISQEQRSSHRSEIRHHLPMHQWLSAHDRGSEAFAK